MSTYTQPTRHPQTGKWENATWHDDYFDHHVYGVEFPSDRKVYTTEMVGQKKILTFWSEDVIMAFREFNHGISLEDAKITEFLNLIEREYKDRWKRDPEGGEGAVEWLRGIKEGKK